MKVLPKLPRPVLISFLRPGGGGQFVEGNPSAVVRRSSTSTEVTREGVDRRMNIELWIEKKRSWPAVVRLMAVVWRFHPGRPQLAMFLAFM